MFDKFPRAPSMRPFLNIGFPFDIQTGKYYTGKDGESILNGGLQHVTGIGGGGNLYKSTVLHYMHLIALERYGAACGMVYDTEPPSCNYPRFEQLSKRMLRLTEGSLRDRLLLTDSTVIVGNKWFKQLKEAIDFKLKSGKDGYAETPFLDEKGNKIKTLLPNLISIDSMSMFTSDNVQDILDENEIGASGANIEAMRGQGAKTQMLVQLPDMATGSNTFIMMTAHAGKQYQMDPRTPLQKQLTFLKQDVKFKNVPEKFLFLTNNLWYAVAASPMINRTTKAPEYPRNSNDDLSGNTDLMLVTFSNLRAKNGPSGMPFELIISQSEGYLRELSALHYLKNSDRFGLGGHDRAYFCHLRPDVSLQRTTVRSKIDGDAKLGRAIEICAELCQITNLWLDTPASVLCTPEELYRDIAAMGYDWEELLDTRGFWVYENDKHPQNFLSTKDLLMMRVGKYQPKWATRKASVSPSTVTKEEVGVDSTTNVVELKPKHLVKASLGEATAA